MPRRRLALAARVISLVTTTSAAAPEIPDSVQVRSERVAGNVWVLMGRGGNIGVLAGPDGVVMVDDEYAPLTDRIRAAIAAINPGPIRFLLNTHWHGDHTGGNENFGRAGVVIVAHDNVRVRMSTEQFMKTVDDRVPASPAAALPVVTFGQDVTVHLDGEETHAFHVPPAHTDGDVVVHFRTSNVIHAGDVYFNGIYPFIDLDSGGSVEGVIAAADRVLGLIGAGTKVIPGHGPLTDKAGLQRYRDMLVKVRDAVRPLVASGRSREEAIAAKPTAPLDAEWGKGFVKPDQFVAIVYDSLKGIRK